MLYKTTGVRAKGKQDLNTGNIDFSTLTLVELVPYNPTPLDENDIKKIRESTKKTWGSRMTGDEWINEIRGGYGE